MSPSKKGTTSSDVLIAAIAAIVAALIGAAATLYATHWQIQAEREKKEQAEKKLQEFRAKYEAAPKTFAKYLGDLISTSPSYQNTPGSDTKSLNPDPEYRRSIVNRATAIVSERNQLRGNLESVGKQLDSQIDALEAELAKPNPDPQRILDILDVLRQTWPSKEGQIELAMKKIIVELGLVEQ